MPDQSSTTELGRYAYDGLDRALHEKARLGIMTSLVARPQGLSFNDLKRLCNLTDGNLNRHLDVLVRGGLIDVIKGYEGRRPNTICRLTANGHGRFLEYLAQLEKVLQDAQRAESASPGEFGSDLAPA